MWRAWRNLKPSAVLLFILLANAVDAAAAESKATVLNTSTPNLRIGPGLEHDVKQTLKEGDQVTVESLEGDWYLVTTSDGQRGYIHKTLLKLADAATPPAAPQKPKLVETKEAAKSASPAAPSGTQSSSPGPPTKSDEKPQTPAPVAVGREPIRAVPEARSPSIIQMLEGRETELKLGLLVAAVAFVIGWICGGNFYLRRDQRSRRKLRF